MEISKKLFFIGSGNMAQAIISGLVQSKLVRPENIVCNDVVKDKLEAVAQKFAVAIAENKGEAIIGSDIIFLSVKPQNMPQVFEEIKHFVKKGAIIISIAAGITTKFIEDSIAKEVGVIRAMPNTPALVLEGTTALCKGRYVSDEQLIKAKTLFEAIGKAEILPEDKFDVITALSGSGPAYVFYLCELMQKAAEKLGLDAATAEKFAVQTIYGAGKMLDITKTPAAKLKEIVKSPNGTTEAALKHFEAQKLEEIVEKAMSEAVRRSKELSR
ncbi:pyrroline-5-carboxylate reductase [Endomicrobium proavitum]|uniref:Pyrroline-5-carboxylate reductase n=1 Tax=Endomicrobium proavitum TaxID=1408281 RepID=A0A0G3WFZ4_9BACT|nr:pyrroline-5-carboxylate reductase [Endomicrobium proavitum]AKL97541.1 Pyrroline-5-carboxylate reductase [Endomicrobium proavitum]